MAAVGAAGGSVRQATARRCSASSTASAACKHVAAHQAAWHHPWAACTALAQRRQRRAAAAAAAAAAAGEQAAGIRIVPSTLCEDLQAAAWLRAEAYYEERSVGRFKQSFIKQFAQQHFYSLLRQAGECVTLVASEGGPEDSDAAAAAGDAPQHQPAAAAAAQRAAAAALAAGGPQGPGSCLGTLDVRLLAPEAAGYGSRWPDGIPLDGPTPAGYVSNVVVSAAQRGRGLGRQLVAEGVALAQRSWGVRCLYCHVETDNEAALRLYRGSGFAQLGEELPPAEEGQGRTLLLCLAVEPGQ